MRRLFLLVLMSLLMAGAVQAQSPEAGSDGIPYDFKLFQRVSGDIALPPGFAPSRVLTRLQPAGGAAVDNSFAWKDVVDPD